MKITHVQAPGIEKEIILRYDVEDEEIKEILQWLQTREKKIPVKIEDQFRLLSPNEILYFESVDNKVFAYTTERVLPVSSTLSELAAEYASVGFIHCSKSMVVNLHRIEALQSDFGGRIIATLQNQEKIIISRHYAKMLRERLLK